MGIELTRFNECFIRTAFRSRVASCCLVPMQFAISTNVMAENKWVTGFITVIYNLYNSGVMGLSPYSYNWFWAPLCTISSGLVVKLQLPVFIVSLADSTATQTFEESLDGPVRRGVLHPLLANTRRKFNIAPKNRQSQKETSLPIINF